MSFQSILEERVGFGKAQTVPFMFLCLIDMNDGVELILSSFLNTLIQKQWALDRPTMQLMASIFYLGVFLGSIISGKLADKYGRKSIITFGSIMQFFIALSFYFVNTIQIMIIVRCLYGFAFGFTICITTSMYAQSAPKRYRGKGLLLINFCVSIGKIYGIFLAYMFLDGFQKGNWKAMMIFSAIPNLFVLIGIKYFIKQSPRYLLAHKQYERAFRIIDQMLIINKGQEAILTQIEKNRLQFSIQANTIVNTQKPEILTLFNSFNIATTLTLSMSWFLANFTTFGQLTILPFIFAAEENSLLSYLVAVLGEIPCLFVSMYLIDKPNFGRKNSMIIFFFFAGISHGAFFFGYLTIFASLARFFMKLVFQMLYPCTTQSYVTKIRSLGFGFCSAFGRIGSIIMPFIIFSLWESSKGGVFILFSGLSFLGCLSTYMIPKEPMNSSIDEFQQKAISIEVSSLVEEITVQEN